MSTAAATWASSKEMDTEHGSHADDHAVAASSHLTEPTDKTRYRFNWTSPALVSQHDANVVYHGGNVLFRTHRPRQDVDADLPRPHAQRQGDAGHGRRPDHERGRGRRGVWRRSCTSPSRRTTPTRSTSAPTTDSCSSRATAGRRGPTSRRRSVASVSRTRSRSHRTIRARSTSPSAWTVTATTLRMRSSRPTTARPGRASRTVCARASRCASCARIRSGAGLLFAGTETGDLRLIRRRRAAGSRSRATFRSVADHRLSVRHGDLYAATEGRAFWALDDLSPLRQMSDQVAKADVHLYAPRPAYFGGGPSAPTTTAGRNPPSGANIFFSLAKAPDSAQVVKLEVLDASGRVLREYPESRSWRTRRPAPGGPVRTMPVPKCRTQRIPVGPSRRSTDVAARQHQHLGRPEWRVSRGTGEVSGATDGRFDGADATVRRPRRSAPQHTASGDRGTRLACPAQSTRASARSTMHCCAFAT